MSQVQRLYRSAQPPHRPIGTCLPPQGEHLSAASAHKKQFPVGPQVRRQPVVRRSTFRAGG